MLETQEFQRSVPVDDDCGGTIVEAKENGFSCGGRINLAPRMWRMMAVSPSRSA